VNEFSMYLILPAALGPRFTQPIMFMGSGARPVHWATILPPSVSRMSRQGGVLNISQPYRPPRPVTGTTLLYGDGVCFL
jgi:hypothetical protein